MAGPTAVSPTANLTIAQAVGSGQLVKSSSLYYNVAVAAGNTVGINFPTFDDNLLRFIIGFWADVSTTGFFYRLLSSGRKMAEFSALLMNAQHGPLGVYVPVAPNVVTELEMWNASGGSITPTSLTLFYSVDDPQWTIGA